MRVAFGLLLTLVALPSFAEETRAPQSSEVLFRNVRVFDGVGPNLSGAQDVLVRGNKIVNIAPARSLQGPQIIEGDGRTLIPGLIDAHVHMTFTSMPMMRLLAPDLTPEAAEAAAAAEAQKMLRRGFTSVRDVGGPVFGLKAGFD